MPGIEDAVFGFGGSYMPDTFESAHAAITRYIGAGNLGKNGGPEAAQSLREFKREELEEPVLEKTEDAKKLKIAEKMYKRRLDAYVEAKIVWEDNSKKIYNLLLSHCTKSMHVKLQSMSNWKDISKKQDGLKLIVLICNVRHHKDETE